MASNKASQASNRQSITLPLSLGFLFVFIISIGWLMELPTQEELLSDTAKIWDHVKIGQGGWSPSFMMGYSGQIYTAVRIPMLLAHIFHFLFAGVFGSYASLKILILSFIPASALSMWLFVRRLGAEASLASWIGLIYITLPSINVAIGIYEHWTVGFSFIFAPLLLRGILTVAEEGSPREIVGLGLAASALALSYTKIAVAMSPLLLFWTIEVLRQNPSRIKQALAGYGLSIVVAALTGVLILLPGSREFGFVAGFIFDPLDFWKHHYAFRSPLLWIDLWGFLISGNSELMTDAQMFQIGLIPLLALSFALSLSSLEKWRKSQLGRWFLILTACWLISIWFASGLDGILIGHFKVLNTAQNFPDISIPILWLSLIWMGWLIYQTASHLFRGRIIIAALLMLVVLAMPVSRILDSISLFRDIRAPESFWSVGGYCCLSAAVGIAFWILFTEVINHQWRKLLAVVAGIAVLVELFPIHSSYWTRGLQPQLLTEFGQATEFLKTAPLQGRVHCLSSRYFYLILPEKSGRALDIEADYHHFELKWMRYLEMAGVASSDSLRTFMDLCGVAYILLDKTDLSISRDDQDFFRSRYPLVFENNCFAVLANHGCLYPAFLSHDIVSLPLESYKMAPTSLQLASRNIVTVEKPTGNKSIYSSPKNAKAEHNIELLGQVELTPTNRVYSVLPEEAINPASVRAVGVNMMGTDLIKRDQGISLTPTMSASTGSLEPKTAPDTLTVEAAGTNKIGADLIKKDQRKEGRPFVRVPLSGVRMDDYQSMAFHLPSTASGWLVVTEAYHPDWRVTIDGKPSEVHRAEAALLSTFVPLGSHEVIFRFKPPAWYSICLASGAFFWGFALFAMLYLSSKYAPLNWRNWWLGSRRLHSASLGVSRKHSEPKRLRN